MKKSFKNALLAVTALVGLTLVSAQTVVHAAEGDAKDDVRLTKTFLAPDKTVSPLGKDFKFDFTFTPDKYYPYGDKNSDGTDRTDSKDFTEPAIAEQSIIFNNSDMGATADGVTTYYKQTDNLLEGLEFPSPGVYTYIVRETANTVTGLDESKKELVQYDGGYYTLKVYVSRDGDDNVIDGGIVTNPDGEKVDPDPKDPQPGGGDHEIIIGNGFNFKNIFTRKGNNEPVDPDPDPDTKNTSLKFTKVVEGGLSKIDDYFTFTLKLTPNALITDKNKDFKLMTSENTAGDSYDLLALPAEGITFKLKGGQKAWVDAIPTGVHFDVTESKFDPYVQSLIPTVNGVVGDKGEDQYAGTIGDKLNQVDYTNTAEKVTPTGIFLNNLPYILLVVALGGAVTLYVVISRKKRA